jgi:protein involved in polysaccharide export with SLBB domain
MSRIEATFNLDGIQEIGAALIQQQSAMPQRANQQPAWLGPFGVPLRQYGYSIFSTNISTFAPVDDVPVGPDYVLGPGDDLTINVWGMVDTTLYRTVDRSGQIALPKVGDLRLWGLTFSQADRLIREQFSRYFRGFQTSVTMGRLRTIRVHVVGEVCQPGVYTLSALSTVTHALFSAGGPTKLGSLREVRLLRNHYQVGALDLYDFLLRGDRTRDLRLESGDTVFVPTIGDVAAVAGEVKRPAIYELKGGLRVSDLIEMAGGATPTSYLRRVQIIRSQPSSERLTIDVDLSRYYLKGDESSNPLMSAGDLVLIHRSDSRVYNTVKVEGALKYPGTYEVKPIMRISQLLPADTLLPEAYADRVEVFRRRPDHSIEIIPVNLKKAWNGETDQDLLLKPLDQVTVRTELRAARTIALTGQIVRPGKYAIAEGERLSSVLERAGGFTDKAFLKGAVFTRTGLRKMEQERLDEFVKVQEQKILAAASTTVVGLDKDEAASPAQTVQAQRELLRALASRVAVGRMILRLDEPAKLRGTEHDVVLVDGDALDVPEPPSSVLVLGSVRNSTSVMYQGGAGLDYYVNRAGGFTPEADKKEVHIVKADGSAITGFANIRTAEPGDTIVVPPKSEEKIRVLPTIRDALQSFSATLLSLVALATLF